MTDLLAAATALWNRIDRLRKQHKLTWSDADLEVLHMEEDELFRQFVRGVASGQLKGHEAQDVAKVLRRLADLDDDWRAYA